MKAEYLWEHTGYKGKLLDRQLTFSSSVYTYSTVVFPQSINDCGKK